MINCMIAGVGGQGTVLASKLIAASAMEIGENVRTTETIGMAQRGGSVVSHVRMGDTVNSPLVPLKSADIIIAFEPAEAVRLTPYLADDGLIIVCDTPIKPVTDTLTGGNYEAAEVLSFLSENAFNSVVLSGEEIISTLGAKVLNTAFLGAAAESGRFSFDASVLENVIKNKMPERFLRINLEAFNLGRKMYNERIK